MSLFQGLLLSLMASEAGRPPSKVQTMSKNSIQLWLVLPPLDATANNGLSAILVTVLFPLSWSNSVVRCQCLCSKAGDISSHQSHRVVVLQRKGTFVPVTLCVCVSVFIQCLLPSHFSLSSASHLTSGRQWARRKCEAELSLIFVWMVSLDCYIQRDSSGPLMASVISILSRLR